MSIGFARLEPFSSPSRASALRRSVDMSAPTKNVAPTLQVLGALMRGVNLQSHNYRIYATLHLAGCAIVATHASTGAQLLRARRLERKPPRSGHMAVAAGPRPGGRPWCHEH